MVYLAHPWHFLMTNQVMVYLKLSRANRAAMQTQCVQGATIAQDFGWHVRHMVVIQIQNFQLVKRAPGGWDCLEEGNWSQAGMME